MTRVSVPDGRPAAESANDEPKESPAWRPLFDAVRSDPRVLFAVAGLALYAVLRVAYVAFYQRFHLSPDDLGFGYLDLLGQAAVVTVVLIVLAAALLSLWVITALAFWSFLTRRPRKGASPQPEPDGPPEAEEGQSRKTDQSPPKSQRAAPAAVIVLSLVLAVALVVAGVIGLVTLLELAGLGAVIPYVGVLVTLVVFARTAFERLEDLRKTHRRELERAIAAAIAGACVGVAILLVAQAAADADDVSKGRGDHPTFASLRMASWGADRAKIRWTSNEAARLAPGLERECAMYFGQHDGTAFLYRHTTGETLRLPASAIAVTINPESCGP